MTYSFAWKNLVVSLSGGNLGLVGLEISSVLRRFGARVATERPDLSERVLLRFSDDIILKMEIQSKAKEILNAILVFLDDEKEWLLVDDRRRFLLWK